MQSTSTAGQHFVEEGHSSNETSDSRDAAKKKACSVCGAEKASVGKQFGADACKACAAFFRRVVVHRQRFRCEASGNCPALPANGKGHCRYCRFQRCLASGMTITGVQKANIHRIQAHDGTQLGRIAAFHKSMFLQRIRAARLLGVNESASHQVITRHSMNLMYQVELQTMKEYFANIMAPVRSRYLSDNADMGTMVDHFCAVWVVFEVVLATMRNHGDLSRKIFYMDESFVPATSDASEKFFSSSMATTHADTVGRQCASHCMKWQLAMASGLKRSGLDEMAIATLRRLIFSRYEKDFFPNLAVHSEYVNDILREFHHHCKDRRVDYFAEVDKITSLLHCFHETFTAWMDTFTMIDLCTPNEDDMQSIWSLSLYRRRKNIDNLLCLSNNASISNVGNAIQYM